jgi:hypothetical protein
MGDFIKSKRARELGSSLRPPSSYPSTRKKGKREKKKFLAVFAGLGSGG